MKFNPIQGRCAYKLGGTLARTLVCSDHSRITNAARLIYRFLMDEACSSACVMGLGTSESKRVLRQSLTSALQRSSLEGPQVFICEKPFKPWISLILGSSMPRAASRAYLTRQLNQLSNRKVLSARRDRHRPTPGPSQIWKVMMWKGFTLALETYRGFLALWKFKTHPLQQLDCFTKAREQSWRAGYMPPGDIPKSFR